MFQKSLKSLTVVLCLIASLWITSGQTLAQETISKSREDTRMLSNTIYIISPKREFKDTVNQDWQEKLTNIQGLEVLGSNLRRMQVKATPEVIETAKKLLGTNFYVESRIDHH